MFEIDRWQEIFSAMSKNKIRTILTAFGVFWGIFMLVIMLGSGVGLRNGIFKEMGDFATNSLFIWTQNTNKPYQGFNKGRSWNFNNEDTKAIRDNIAELDVLAPRIHPPSGSVNIVRGKNTEAYRVNGDYPDFNRIDPVSMIKGRFINNMDINDQRKIAVIGQRVNEVLFPKNEEALGKYIQIQGVYFQVVGVYKSKHGQGWGKNQNETVIIPFTTLQKTYNLGNVVFYYGLVAKPQYSAELVENKMRALLANRHKIAPDDKEAFGSENVEKQFSQMNNLFIGINFLTWFVGALTLIAGVVGISNIMLIIIRERTKEIGVQRALGAAPIKIITQIIMESVFLTFVAGLMGMVVGILIIELVNVTLMKTASESTMFLNPEINLKAAIWSLALLIVSGTLAGLIPARRAIKIKPIDALRAEI
jgi:putative ABC transport system permease protein